MVDWDNFSTRCAAQGVAVQPDDLKRLGRAAGGDLVWSAIFVDSSTLAAGERIKLFSAGFTIHDCPKMKVGTSGHLKDTVDPAMIEQLHAAAEFLPVDRIILCSEDRDYIRVVQRLRDAGKRVTVVVPSPRDRPELARHADDVLVYTDHANARNDVFAKVAKRFGSGAFHEGGTGDACAEVMDKLIAIVRVLDDDLSVNSMHYGFLALMRKTKNVLSAKGISIPESETKRLLEFLIAQDVLVTRSMKVKRAAGGRGSGKGDSPIHYKISRTHPFVVWLECGGDTTPAETSAERAAAPPYAIDEEHPQVRRFRARYGDKADAAAPKDAPPATATDDVAVPEAAAAASPEVPAPADRPATPARRSTDRDPSRDRPEPRYAMSTR